MGIATKASVARTPVFGVRGSYLAKSVNLKEERCPQVLERESRQKPQTSKAEACATLPFDRYAG
jgi:hypothetical protein